MARAHLLPFALAALAGMLAEPYGFGPAAVLGVVAAATCLRGVGRATRAGWCAALLLGVADARCFAHAAKPAPDGHVRRFVATVVDATSEAGSDAFAGARATLRLDDGTLASAVLPGAPPPIGERILVRGRREPFDDARNPGEASPRELEAERGVAWRLAHVRVLAHAPPDPHDATLWIARLRALASRRLHAALGEPEATILAGAMWGERGTLAPDLRAEFQDTGTVHVLVTAGLHLGVVAAVALALLRALGCGRVSSSLLAIVIVWTYAAFSGAHLPSLRAATMLSFALLARAAGREATSWNALAAAAIVVAAVRPASVASISFALSFSCVAAIFAFAAPFATTFERLRAPRLAAEALALTCATQLGTWPLTASAFLVIAPYAPLANALVVPVVGVAMLVGFVALAVTPVPPLAALADHLEIALVDWIVGCVRFFGTLPGAHLVATPPPPWTIATYDAALVAAGFAVARGRIALAVAVVACASSLCLWPPRAPRAPLVVTAIDVGQADALLVQTPRGHAFLVDAGGRLERGPQTADASTAEDVGTRVVVPLLVRAGVHRLDAVLLSHPHGDHAGGVAPVLRALGSRAFADSGQTYPGHAYQDALAVARTSHVPILEPRAGDVWRTDDGATFRFYGPSVPYISGSRNDINANSLVFRLEYGRTRMLFMGDAGTETERRLLAAGDDLHADVLKVGHHGSAYGTTPAFVRAVAPAIAVISVGRHNLFGHPAASTIATLEGAGATVLRTDRDGAISIHSDGAAVTAERFLASAQR
jgi:competence protein ComEC